MALSSEIIAKLGLDSSAFVRALSAVPVQVEKFGGEASKALERKFSGTDIFKGVLQGVGIASVGQIADRLVEPFKESAESASRIAEYSEKAAAATERLLSMRRDDAQQLAALEKQYARIAEEAKKPAELGIWETMKTAILAGPLMALQKLKEKRDELTAEKQAKASAELAEKAVQIEQQKQAIKKKADEEDRRGAEEAARNDRARVDAAKDLAEFEHNARRAKMSDEKLLLDLAKEKTEVTKRITAYAKFEKEGGKLTADGIRELVELKKQQESIEKNIVEVTERKRAAEAAVVKEVEKQNAGLRVGFEIRGRGNEVLTDRELKSKERKLTEQLFQTQLMDQNPQGLNLFTSQLVTSQDPFKGFKERELEALRQEATLRGSVRSRTKFFGESAAFEQFGLSEERFRQLLENRQPSTTDRINRTLQSIEERMRRPQAVIVVGGGLPTPK